MNKVICDICGSAYPDTADTCPICGCSRDAGAELLAEDENFLKDSPIASAKKVDGVYRTAPEEPEEDWDEDDEEEADEEEEEAPRRGKTAVVILLTVLIMLLLCVCGFLFVRYLLPYKIAAPAETEAAKPTEAVVETTTEPGIPCEQLVLMSGAAVDLTREGEYRLINVIVKPEDSTDTLTYSSADESVATVNKEGRITAVGEGETVITITCGSQELECRIFVRYEEETVPPTEETEATEATDSTEETAETQAEETVDSTEATEATEATEETEETQASLKDVELRLGKSDISLGVGIEYVMPLNCELDYSEIEWSIEHPQIATVENGVIKTHRTGTTELTAKYGDQVVTCMIRVKF